MALGRGEREWTLLVSEYNICKKKLESKREGLQILMKDLKTCQRERDIYKNKIYQLQQENDKLKQQQEREKAAVKAREVQAREKVRLEKEKREKEEAAKGYGQSVWDQQLQSIRQRKNKTLSQLLIDTKEENKALQNDLINLRQLYKEAQEDILLLRENIARQSFVRGNQGDVTHDVSVRQDLIIQLEEHQEKIADLERDLQAAQDEKSEVSVERDHFRDKSERLNTQLNYILGADDRRLVDIDAVLMENRYMKEQIKQLKEEKGLASAAVARYKAAFEKRRNKVMKAIYRGQSQFTKHTLSSILQDLSGVQGGQVSASAIAELQFLANSLSESLTDKDIALAHQKNTNKILGARVAELEKKLKTLEVAGLWSLPGHRGYGSKEMEIVNKLQEQSVPDKRQQNTVDSPREEMLDGKDSNIRSEHEDDLHDIHVRLMLSSTVSESEDEFERNLSSPEDTLNNDRTSIAAEGLLVNVATSPSSAEDQVAESFTSREGCVSNKLRQLSGCARDSATLNDSSVSTNQNGFEDHAGEDFSGEFKTSKNFNGHSRDLNDFSKNHSEHGASHHEYSQSHDGRDVATHGTLNDTLESDTSCSSPDSAAFDAEMRVLTLRISSSGSEGESESGNKTTESEEQSESSGYVDTNTLSVSHPSSPVDNATSSDVNCLQLEIDKTKECLSDSELAQLLYNVSSVEEF